MTPHARHLAEMRATVVAQRAPAAGLPMGIASLAMLAAPIDEAQIARARELVRDLHLRRDIPDPTRRHLAEMRMSVDRAAASMPISAMLALPRTPTGDELVAAMRKEVRRG